MQPQSSPNGRAPRRKRREFPRRKQRSNKRDKARSLNWSEDIVFQQLKALKQRLEPVGIELEIECEPDLFDTDLPRRGGTVRKFAPDFRIVFIDHEDDGRILPETFYFEVTCTNNLDKIGIKKANIRSVKRVHNVEVVLLGLGRVHEFRDGRRDILFYFPYLAEQLVRERLASGETEAEETY